MGPKGLYGHVGSKGETIGQRIKKYGKPSGGVGENIAYGNDYAISIMAQLIVDDGLASRIHRSILLKEKLKVMGSFSGPHKEISHMTCIDYAGGFN